MSVRKSTKSKKSPAPVTAQPAVQGLFDVYDAKCVLVFLDAIRLLGGGDYSVDRRIVRGDALIREFAAVNLLGMDEVQLSAMQAADVLYVLHNIEPNDESDIFDGSSVHVGFSLIVSWVERSLLGADMMVTKRLMALPSRKKAS